jgi:carbamoyltransferase
MVNILGLHFGHDGSACIVKDGRLVSAISTERLNGIKKFYGVIPSTIDYVLNKAGIGYEDIDVITLADYIGTNSHDTLSLFDKTGAKIDLCSQTVFGNDMLELDGELNGFKIPVIVLPHHTCHAASAFYTSNLDESVALTMDGCGGDLRSSSWLAVGKGNKLNHVAYPGMRVGELYGDFTMLLGLGPSVYKAGSTMGLASYGKPSENVIYNTEKWIKRLYAENYHWSEAGPIFHEIWEDEEIEVKHIEYDSSSDATYYEQLMETCECNLVPLGGRGSKDIYPFETKSGMIQAANIQHLFEKQILDTIDKSVRVSDQTKDVKNICLAGGSFLNCNANSAIKATGYFDNVHLFPGAGDDGICVGSALYYAHHVLDYPRETYSFSDLAYMGSENSELKEEDYAYLANEIANGKIIAWVSGASEYGPRALGHRSILADPRNFHNREILNFLVKKREWFRPFAPVVLEEEAHNWFEPSDPSKYMLFTQRVLQPEKIPAVTHVDNTARMQTINEEDNKPYYKLIQEFFKITGIPMLINTSYNANGKPIVHSKQQALNAFHTNKGIDILVLNGKIITK